MIKFLNCYLWTLGNFEFVIYKWNDPWWPFRLFSINHHKNNMKKPEAKMKTNVNIPTNLEECIILLQTTALCDEDREAIRTGSEINLCMWHDNLGRWIRNNWGLWSADSDLYNWFKERGITHPDDISGIILTSFWRRLNDKPLELEEQIKYYQDYWKKETQCQITVTVEKKEE